MRLVRPTLLLLLAALPAAALSGCAIGWRSEIDPAAARYEAALAGKLPEKKHLRVTVDVQDFRSMTPEQVIRVSQRWEGYGVQYLGASGVFASVSAERAEADMELRLHLRETANSNSILATLTFLTLGILPMPLRVETEAEGEVRTPQGVHRGIKIRESREHVVSLLLMPVHFTAAIATRRFRHDVFKSALVQMLERPEIWSGQPPRDQGEAPPKEPEPAAPASAEPAPAPAP